MPTGYTATLVENGQTFQEFIMGCARAFGALIEIRDSPDDAPIPDKFEPSDYHTKKIIEASETLAKLKTMTNEEKKAFGDSEKTKDIQRIKQWLERENEQNKRLEDMSAQVKAWTPPSKDHQGLKDFMLQQINISKNNVNYIESSLSKAKAIPATAYYVAAVSKAARNIKYHTEENIKEIDRANGRSEWIQQLRASI